MSASSSMMKSSPSLVLPPPCSGVALHLHPQVDVRAAVRLYLLQVASMERVAGERASNPASMRMHWRWYMRADQSSPISGRIMNRSLATAELLTGAEAVDLVGVCSWGTLGQAPPGRGSTGVVGGELGDGRPRA